MSAAMDRRLSHVFTAFAGGPRMDSRAFLKCLRVAGLLDTRLGAADADLVFARCRPRESRKLDLALFGQALCMIALKRGEDESHVRGCVLSVDGAEESEAPAPCDAGPSRLFYDRSSYTGTHRNGGPTTAGAGLCDGDVICDQELVNRSFVFRQKSVPVATIVLTDEQELASDQVWVGPERFFYDRSTYTGTHRHGGPDVLGNGLPKSGYSDLSELVDRDHVQDDALHRSKLGDLSQILEEDALNQQKSGDLIPMPEEAPGEARLPVLLGARSAVEPLGITHRKDQDSVQSPEHTVSDRPAPRGENSERGVVSAAASPALPSRPGSARAEVAVASPHSAPRSPRSPLGSALPSSSCLTVASPTALASTASSTRLDASAIAELALPTTRRLVVHSVVAPVVAVASPSATFRTHAACPACPSVYPIGLQRPLVAAARTLASAPLALLPPGSAALPCPAPLQSRTRALVVEPPLTARTVVIRSKSTYLRTVVGLGAASGCHLRAGIVGSSCA